MTEEHLTFLLEQMAKMTNAVAEMVNLLKDTVGHGTARGEVPALAARSGGGALPARVDDAELVKSFIETTERVLPPDVRKQVEGVEDPIRRSLMGAKLTLERTSISSDPETEDAVHAAVIRKVKEHVKRFPELKPLERALMARLSCALRREFGARRFHGIPLGQAVQEMEYIESYRLIEPSQMRPLARQILRACSSARMNLTEAARAMGTHQRTVVRWVMGEHEPSRDSEAVLRAFFRRFSLREKIVALNGGLAERAADPARLRSLRRHLGMTLKDAAAVSGVSITSVWKLEHGRPVRNGREIEGKLLEHYSSFALSERESMSG